MKLKYKKYKIKIKIIEYIIKYIYIKYKINVKNKNI